MRNTNNTKVLPGWYRPKSHPGVTFKLADVSLVNECSHVVSNMQHPAILVHVGGHGHSLVFERGDEVEAFAERKAEVERLMSAIGGVTNG